MNQQKWIRVRYPIFQLVYRIPAVRFNPFTALTVDRNKTIHIVFR